MTSIEQYFLAYSCISSVPFSKENLALSSSDGRKFFPYIFSLRSKRFRASSSRKLRRKQDSPFHFFLSFFLGSPTFAQKLDWKHLLRRLVFFSPLTRKQLGCRAAAWKRGCSFVNNLSYRLNIAYIFRGIGANQERRNIMNE